MKRKNKPKVILRKREGGTRFSQRTYEKRCTEKIELDYHTKKSYFNKEQVFAVSKRIKNFDGSCFHWLREKDCGDDRSVKTDFCIKNSLC